MLKAIALLGLLWLGPPATTRAQAPTWQTVLTPGAVAPHGSDISSTAADANGNIYLVGSFSGNLRLGNILLASAGQNDAFVAKYNPTTSTYLWARSYGGFDDDALYAVTVRGTAVYLAGGFRSRTLTLGSVTLQNQGAVNSSPTYSYNDGFVLKLTDQGTNPTVDWAQSVGSGDTDYIVAMTLNGNDLYVAGDFSGPSLTLGNLVVTNPQGTMNNPGGSYVAKLSDAGSTSTWRWALPLGSDISSRINAFTSVGTTLYLTADFIGSQLQLGSTLVAASTTTNFIARLTDTGSTATVGWVQPLAENAYVTALAATATSLYLGGLFSGPTLTVGPTTLTNAAASTQWPTEDLFVAKLTNLAATPSYAWALSAGGLDREGLNTLVINGNNLYLAGTFFSNNVQFGPSLLVNTLSPVPQGLDAELYVAKVADAGSSARFEWGQQASGVGADVATSITLHGTTVYVSGYVIGNPTTFGSLPVAVATQNFLGFCATLTDNTLLATTPAPALAGLRVFPNPARHSVQLQLPAAQPAAQPLTLTLTDALGRSVRSATVPAAQLATGYSLDLSGLAPGLYLVRLSNGGTLLTRQLVVE
ncbi:T9SS type A sorting domain-containing protein [Hymenobacter sp. ASUV-10]|uniref:T9SS type A sorting domain-containing protein n=1 Tax=Hymenobacter aranciens TaxID=3063996 RepID=A0ABT9BAW8_9BACT|nr:T9SS type A sorting domain-containing protein [Hymenobacter sp. ASUV-10]MDO7875416.1 T9SS type A sorting domain-containing protein [Hymenobacter sp. ASUV-10]